MYALLAQLVEQLTSNEQVVGSSPTRGSRGGHTSDKVKRRREAFETKELGRAYGIYAWVHKAQSMYSLPSVHSLEG